MTGSEAIAAAERLPEQLREATTVLDEPFHYDAIAVNLEEAAAALATLRAALLQSQEKLLAIIEWTLVDGRLKSQDHSVAKGLAEQALLMLSPPVAPKERSPMSQETNEDLLFQRLSTALTGGNARTWDELLHAAETPTDPPAAPTGTDAGVAELVERLREIGQRLSLHLGADYPDAVTCEEAAAALAQQATQLQEARAELSIAAEQEQFWKEACIELQAALSAAQSERDEAREQFDRHVAWADEQSTSLRAELETAQQVLAEANRKLSEAAFTSLGLLHRANTAEADFTAEKQETERLHAALEAAETALAEARRALDEAKAEL